MGTFKSEKTFFADASLMNGVAEAIENEFKNDSFEVQMIQLGTGGYDISVAKGNIFKAILGMKSALKIIVEPVPHGIHVKASVGIFGQQAIPSAITLFIAWPVLVTQIWGMVEQSKLDDKAILVAENYINAHSSDDDSNFKFCPHCGTKQPVSNCKCEKCGREI
jgi:hypothetical protein